MNKNAKTAQRLVGEAIEQLIDAEEELRGRYENLSDRRQDGAYGQQLAENTATIEQIQELLEEACGLFDELS